MKIITTLFMLFLSLSINAQQIIAQEKYLGTIDGKINISFYLKIEETGCPKVVASGIYKYTDNKAGNWILLDTTFSEKAQQYTFVEHYNTGIMLLKRDNDGLQGLWISPDGKKQLKVSLKKLKPTKAEIDKMEDELEKANYNANDC
ncbi:hypothetical protein IX39_10630 [Chryseobacterium formosense]|uniref:Uncharacterized protein n=1 Tax=Chryseobacterium formosense TaxID=236814 RepID=A0A085Z9D3_9FLAO|nr:hypothetical protein [Chryseobacterium formosense]KFF01047.1 hypothetical protein IX39_10630 [Chryseobacterium formosense]SFT41329.1 hypothetical protein SAMN05421857_0820 [Chryseobacterium formosense]